MYILFFIILIACLIFLRLLANAFPAAGSNIFSGGSGDFYPLQKMAGLRNLVPDGSPVFIVNQETEAEGSPAHETREDKATGQGKEAKRRRRLKPTKTELIECLILAILLILAVLY